MRVTDLYAEPPERFIAARDALAARLRATDPALANEVRRLRKPSLALWALNQLARRRAGPLARFVEGPGLDRKLLDDLVREAATILEESGHGAPQEQLRRVEEMLRAAPLAAPGERDALLEGTLGRPLALGDVDTMLALAASRRAEAGRRPPATKRAEARAGGPLVARRGNVARGEALRAAKHAEAVARTTAERLAASAKAAEERAERAHAEAEAARKAAEASAREVRKKATATQKAARRHGGRRAA